MPVDYSKPRISIRQDTTNGSRVLSVVNPWPKQSKIDKSVIESKPAWLTIMPDGIVCFQFNNGTAMYRAIGYNDVLEYWELEYIQGDFESVMESV